MNRTPILPYVSVFLLASIIVAVLYTALFAITEYVLNPLQDLFYPNLSSTLSLTFLPHGVRVLATIVMGWRAVPALVLASLFCGNFFFGINDSTALVLLAIISGFGPWVTLSGLRLLDVDAFFLEKSGALPPFRTLLLGGILCSVTNGLLSSAILEAYYGVSPVALVQLGYIVGDTTGLIITWIAAQKFIKLLTDLKK